MLRIDSCSTGLSLHWPGTDLPTGSRGRDRRSPALAFSLRPWLDHLAGTRFASRLLFDEFGLLAFRPWIVIDGEEDSVR